MPGSVDSVALCWRLERSDGAGIALTTHDAQLSRDGVIFLPAPGVTPASVVRSAGLEPASGEIDGVLSADALSETDLTVGRWNGARISLTAVKWDDAAADTIQLMGGELGDVTLQGGGFSAELQGAAVRLERPFCPTTSPECRARFGDSNCRVDLAGRTLFATVIETGEGQLRLDQVIGEQFLLGRLRYRSGGNCGVATTIIGVSGDTVRVRDLPRQRIEAGCRIELREGCDKRLETCAQRFNNAVNFRGEPHLPGNDLLTRYPGA